LPAGPGFSIVIAAFSVGKNLKNGNTNDSSIHVKRQNQKK
jgi:hypothetical protein